MDSTACEFPDQPGVYCAEKQFSLFRFFSCTFHIVQNPGNFGGRKIGIGNESGLPADDLVKTVLFQLFHHLCSTAALPYNGIVYRFSRDTIPHDSGFALIGNADCGDVPGLCTGHCHGLHGHRQLGRPDFHGIVLHPAGLGINLVELLLGNTADLATFVKQDTPGTGGTLV